MSQQSKPARTLIADLPQIAGELSAEALDQVVGGAARTLGTTNLPLGGARVSAAVTYMATLSINGTADSVAMD